MKTENDLGTLSMDEITSRILSNAELTPLEKQRCKAIGMNENVAVTIKAIRSMGFGIEFPKVTR